MLLVVSKTADMLTTSKKFLLIVVHMHVMHCFVLYLKVIILNWPSHTALICKYIDIQDGLSHKPVCFSRSP